MLYCIISGHGFMAEISISVVLWGFGSKNYRFRLQAHEGVESLGKKKKVISLVVFWEYCFSQIRMARKSE